MERELRAYVMRKRKSAYLTVGMRDSAPEIKDTKQTIAAKPYELEATEVLTMTTKPATAPRTVVMIRNRPF